MHRRVELNAFASDELVRWIEAKLQEPGVRKVVPDDKMLAEEYRRQCESAYLQEHFNELLERSRQHIAGLDVSAGLRDEMARLRQDRPALAWNDAVAEIAGGERIDDEAGDQVPKATPFPSFFPFSL